MSTMRTVTPFVLGLACGAGAFLAWQTGEEPARADRGEEAPGADGTESSGCREALDAPTLRRVLRQELAGLAVEAAPPAPTAPEAPHVAEEDPETAAEHDATFVEVTERLDQALYEGVWDEDDAVFLRPRLARLRSDDRDEVMAQLVPALNSGELVQRVDGMPF